MNNTAPTRSSQSPPEAILERWQQARQRRTNWDAHWQECYDYALPQRDSQLSNASPGGKRTDKLFDGTACDAVDQLAASLLSQLTPPWARWFGLTPGPDADEAERELMADSLERAAQALQSNFDRSNFAIEVHQCYLDLVTAGTACLMFEEAPAGEPSAFRFMAVPLSQVAFEENAFGQLDTTFRRSELTTAQLRQRFPDAVLTESSARNSQASELKIVVIEAVIRETQGFTYQAITEPCPATDGKSISLACGKFERSPFINFRWIKAPGEIYGRSPVMKALPDIKTANKVVELVLKNATIAVTGIWQADDDGVLNPATISLVPGTIIPKAVGSAGLTPLETPGRFDVSQMVLTDLRQRIRHALLADKLGQPDSPKMSATEVVERSVEMARLLGATHGRLQSELLTPLFARALAILKRRGEVDDLHVDGRLIDLEYKSPLAREQAKLDARNTLMWIESISSMGEEARSVVDFAAAARWLGRSFGVPQELILEQPEGLDGEDQMELGEDMVSELMDLPPTLVEETVDGI